jgi:7-cyano-7-deazaguanine synthase
MRKYVVVHSGGLDSTVLLYHLRDLGHHVRALSVNYGQRHAHELQQAVKICKTLDIEHQFADLTGITHLLGGSSQTDPSIPVPHGHYAAENMKVTVVPNRNMIMLSVAIGWAISTKSDAVAYAAHAGDHTIYPDCRPEFGAAMNVAAYLADWHQVEVVRPFVNFTKAEIVAFGAKLNVPFQDTYSCYEGRPVHCGKCGTCVERIEAFHLANVPDPTEYANPAAALA